ncbi:MAG: Phosphate transporter periplasmic phosphate-binding protein, partial [Sphingomonas bacterium]|nr:Phosphate transporter periplasmic phosphate-binding protein [Sphingomonas bacterium]
APLVAQHVPKGEGTGKGESTDGLAMQAARGNMMSARGRKVAYTQHFDVSGIPAYQPRHQISGTLRLWGSNYITDGMLGGLWEAAFRKYHPGVRFDWHMKTTEAAVPSLVFGVSDVGIGRKVTFSELQLYQRYTDHDPLEIELATGSYDVPGWQSGFGVIVNKDNPLAKISMDQLDGIFGAERSGGWEGTSWRPNWARGPEKNIRTWGQLGLKGEWADKPIHVYGLNLKYHQASEISDWILKGSDKWNETLRMYANYVTADGKLARGMNEDLAADKYGIGIVAAPTTSLGGGGAQASQKLLPVAQTDAGPYVPYTLETVQDRSYPMFDRIYAYANTDPKAGLDPKVIEFLRFVVSREGQEAIMQDGKYLPLPVDVAKAMLAKLDAVAK